MLRHRSNPSSTTHGACVRLYGDLSASSPLRVSSAAPASPLALTFPAYATISRASSMDQGTLTGQRPDAAKPSSTGPHVSEKELWIVGPWTPLCVRCFSVGENSSPPRRVWIISVRAIYFRMGFTFVPSACDLSPFGSLLCPPGSAHPHNKSPDAVVRSSSAPSPSSCIWAAKGL